MFAIPVSREPYRAARLLTERSFLFTPTDMIEVKEIGGGEANEFQVRVRVGKGESNHRVSVSAETVEALGAGAGAAELVRASFEFLLEREPKEAIMSRFDLTVIGRYFPEYEQEIGNYLR